MSDYTDYSYDTDTTTIDTSFDTGYGDSYEVTTIHDPYTEAPAFEPGFDVVETDSYTYDSTDWGVVADASEAYMEDYNTLSDTSWDLYNAGVDAYLAGDEMAAYDLNAMSIEMDGYADQAWDDSNSVWESNEWTTVDTYEAADTGWTDTSSYDTTSYDTGSYDTSSFDTSSYDTSSYDTSSDVSDY